MYGRLRNGVALLMCGLAVFGVAMLPARAHARTATRLSITATTTTARVSRKLTLTGRLTRASGRSLSGRTVSLESRMATGGAWSLVSKHTTSSTGRALWKVRPRLDTLYRVRYRGSSAYRPAMSTSRRIAGHHYVTRFLDSFNGSKVNTAMWTPSMQWGNHTLGQLQLYSPKALEVEHGKLVITATRRTPTSAESRRYRSGVVSSHGIGQYHFKYGYIETRAKIPKGMGLWPAVWLLPLDSEANSEIDILEVRGQLPRRNDMTLHFNHDQVKDIYVGSDLSAGYHTFAVNWNADRVIWYRDGIERYRVTNRSQIPDEYMYLIANMQLGDWGGTPRSSTPFPAHFYVDYIRVFQHE